MEQNLLGSKQKVEDFRRTIFIIQFMSTFSYACNQFFGVTDQLKKRNHRFSDLLNNYSDKSLHVYVDFTIRDRKTF